MTSAVRAVRPRSAAPARVVMAWNVAKPRRGAGCASMAPVPAAAPTTTTPALAAALVVAAAAAVACGPRPGAEPLPTAATERAAFVIAAADAGTLARAIDALDPLGGERLAA